VCSRWPCVCAGAASDGVEPMQEAPDSGDPTAPQQAATPAAPAAATGLPPSPAVAALPRCCSKFSLICCENFIFYFDINTKEVYPFYTTSSF